jgi:hypothetical protein
MQWACVTEPVSHEADRIEGIWSIPMAPCVSLYTQLDSIEAIERENLVVSLTLLITQPCAFQRKGDHRGCTHWPCIALHAATSPPPLHAPQTALGQPARSCGIQVLTFIRQAGQGNLSATPALFSFQISLPNSTMQKEDSLSHQNTGPYMEY